MMHTGLPAPSRTPSADHSTTPCTEALRMPDFQHPWASACSPHAAAIEATMRDWLEHSGLMADEHSRNRANKGKFGWLVARAHPYAAVEHLQILANFYAWYHLVDDYHVDQAQATASQAVAGLTALLDILDLGHAGPRPVYGEVAWMELCRQLKSHMPAEQFARFAHGMRMWIGASAFQLLELNQARPIDLRQYETIRRHGSGVFAAFDLVIFAHDIALSPDEYHRPDVEQLRLLGNNIVSWSNDVHSFATELQEAKGHKNMVLLHMYQGYSPQTSIDLTTERVDAEIQSFAKTAATIRKHASRALLDYIEGIELWLSGYQAWINHDTQRHQSAFAEPAAIAPAG